MAETLLTQLRQNASARRSWLLDITTDIGVPCVAAVSCAADGFGLALGLAAHGEFDGVVAMYHDQGHIPIKLVARDAAVNVTLGLPIVRTSPSHGTAFDIAGRGLASAQGMKEAIRVAVALASKRSPVAQTVAGPRAD